MRRAINFLRIRGTSLRINPYYEEAVFCSYCGHRIAPGHLEYDHITPLIHGGPTNWTTNIAPVCRRCNRRKGPRSLVVWLAIEQERANA